MAAMLARATVGLQMRGAATPLAQRHSQPIRFAILRVRPERQLINRKNVGERRIAALTAWRQLCESRATAGQGDFRDFSG